jgi:hypothetical protein
MATDYDIPEHSQPASNAAMDTPKPDPAPEHANAATGPAQAVDEMALLQREGLPADAIVLVPSVGPTPMRIPDDVWAMLVLAVDVIDDGEPETDGRAVLFAGAWLANQPPVDLHDGDLVIRLSPPHHDVEPSARDDHSAHHAVDVEMLLAHRRRWSVVGRWSGLDERWPWTLAPTAAAVMELSIDAAETLSREVVLSSERFYAPPFRWTSTVLNDLISVGLLNVGDVLVWDSRAGEVRHTARIRMDGTIMLADQRVFATPSAAATALSVRGKHHHGWSVWRCVLDGRTLSDLRAEMRERRGN